MDTNQSASNYDKTSSSYKKMEAETVEVINEITFC
jgi:hypothetical protein